MPVDADSHGEQKEEQMASSAALPESFWVQNPEVLGDETLQLIYAEVCSLLRQENPDADTLEMLMVERVAFLYVFLRNKETKKAVGYDRTYKDLMSLWANLAGELRKQRSRGADAERIRDQVLLMVQKAVENSVKALPAEAIGPFKDKFLSELEEAGI